MDRFFDKQVDLRTFSPLTLAYIGDGVYELMMREYLLQKGNCPSGKLHALTVAHVRAEAQAEAAQHLMHLLTEEEMDVLKRGAQRSFQPQNPSKGFGRPIPSGYRLGGLVWMALSQRGETQVNGVVWCDCFHI